MQKKLKEKINLECLWIKEDCQDDYSLYVKRFLFVNLCSPGDKVEEKVDCSTSLATKKIVNVSQAA